MLCIAFALGTPFTVISITETIISGAFTGTLISTHPFFLVNNKDSSFPLFNTFTEVISDSNPGRDRCPVAGQSYTNNEILFPCTVASPQGKACFQGEAFAPYIVCGYFFIQ